MRDIEEIRQDRLKVHFVKPEGEISRRELFEMAVPRYEIVPYIETALCSGSQECGLCLNACLFGAIKAEVDEVSIDTDLCSGCGACLTACPCRAIVYPTFSLQHLDEGMERLLATEGSPQKLGILAFTCQTCLSESSGNIVARFAKPSSIASLDIPCLAMASPWLILRAFERGVQEIALISKRGKCTSKYDLNIWQEDVRFVRELVSCWGIESERIRAFEVTDDNSGSVTQELEQFAKQIAMLGPTLLKKYEPTLVSDDGLLLPALIKALNDELGCSQKRVITAGHVPFGRLELDNSQCTGCSLCATECPTGALTTTSDDEGVYQLLFRHDLCVACARCVGICPEQCLGLERILELDNLNSSKVLFEDSIARCRECGDIIGPRAMIDRLEAKLLAGESVTSQLRLCNRCKVEKLSLSKTTLTTGTNKG